MARLVAVASVLASVLSGVLGPCPASTFSQPRPLCRLAVREDCLDEDAHGSFKHG